MEQHLVTSSFKWVSIVYGGEEKQKQQQQSFSSRGCGWDVVKRFERIDLLFDDILAPIWGLPAQRLVAFDDLEQHCMEPCDDGCKGEQTLVIRIVNGHTSDNESNSTGIQVFSHSWGTHRKLSEAKHLLQTAINYLELCEASEPSARLSVREESSSSFQATAAVTEKSKDVENGSNSAELTTAPTQQGQRSNIEWVFPMKLGTSAARAAVARVAILDVVIDRVVPADSAIRQVANLACCLTAPSAIAGFYENEAAIRAEVEIEGSLHARRLLFELRPSELPSLPSSGQTILQKYQQPVTSFDDMIRGAAQGFYANDTVLTQLLENSRSLQGNRNLGSNRGSGELLCRCKKSCFGTPIWVEYGFNVIAKEVFANLGVVMMDSAPIYMSPGAGIGPGVNIYTSYPPMRPGMRKKGISYSVPVEIGRDAIIFGNSTICPGVRIGENAVIAGGSVVTCDVAANSLYAGNPAKFIRKLSERDDAYGKPATQTA